MSKAFNLIVKIATGIKSTDTQSGLKAGEGRALREIFKLVVVKRYAFDVELLAIARLLDMRTVEMPVELTLDRRFKVRDIVRMFIDVMAIAYRYRIKGYYQKKIERD